VIRKRGPWKTLEDVEFATLEWVDWFNNRRLLEYTGYIPPAEFEEMYHCQQRLVEDEGLKQMSLQCTRGGSELRSLALPNEMTITKSDSLWERHAYLDADGKYPATLNKWEAAVVRQELDHDDTVVWFRNIPRKPWALTVPYEVGGKPAAFYPDFLFARQHDGEWTMDLLDPHHIDLADAPAKALGLAKYAAKHHAAFNRIELIIVKGADDEIRRIDLVDEACREKVLAVKTKEHLALLFEGL